MSYLNRFWRSMRAAFGPAAMPPMLPHVPLEKRPYAEPALPAAFKRAPTPRPPEPADWSIIDAKQWHIYRALDHFTYYDHGYHVKGHPNEFKPIPAFQGMTEYSPKTTFATVKARATGWLDTVDPKILRMTVPLPFNIYWWWHKQQCPEGTYVMPRGEVRPLSRDEIEGYVFWLGAEPVLVAKMWPVAFHPRDLPSWINQWHYITRLKLPQPPAALQQTIVITPELTSELKVGAK